MAVAPLLGNGFRVIAPSRPGYLRTPLSTGQTFEQQSDAMVALLDTLGLERVSVIGASGGGPVAIHLALRHRERVSSLILWEAISARISHFSMDNLSRGPMLWNITEWLVSHVAPAVVPFLVPPEIKSDPIAVPTLQRVAASGFPIASRQIGIKNDSRLIRKLTALPLSNITVPTLLVHGTDDTFVPHEQARAACSSIPTAKLVSIPDGTHISSLVDPIAREAIQHFLRCKESNGDLAT